MRTIILVTLLATKAYAEDIDTTEDDFDPLMIQLGIGGAVHPDRGSDLDASLRLGKIWGVGHHTYAGGFAELHTFGFDSLDVAAGPQLQREIGDIARVQLRAGLGASEAGALALGGIQLAHAFVGATVTARRDLSRDETSLSFTIEVQPLLIIAAILLRDSGGD